MKFADDICNAWRWVSVQMMTLAGAIQGAWLFVPDDMKARLPNNVVQYLTLFLLVIGVWGRLTQQKNLQKNGPES